MEVHTKVTSCIINILNKKDELILVSLKQWNAMVDKITQLTKAVEMLKNPDVSKMVYTNSDIQQLLNVNEKLIRKYRNEGLLSYSVEGCKYWYTAQDVTNFFEKTKEYGRI